MNKLQKEAIATLFCEWFRMRTIVQDVCDELDYVNCRPIARCEHRKFHPYTQDEGTDGIFDDDRCPMITTVMYGEYSTYEERLEYYSWARDNCPHWHHYFEQFLNDLIEDLEGEL